MNTILWQCPECGTENEDVPDETTWPMCSNCEYVYEWVDIDND